MPSLIFLVFGTTNVILDTYRGLYNQAFVQIWITALVTFLLNVLCQHDMSFISWVFVFVPFILMSVVAALLLFVFGLDPASGKQVAPSGSAPTTGPFAVSAGITI
jgi:hypothetical protein